MRHANALAAPGSAVLLLATPSTHVLLPARRGPGAAPDTRFHALVGLGSAPNVLLAAAALGVDTVAELVARARRESLVYASAGAGQTIHLCTALFCAMAGVRMTHRPYEAGSAAAYADLAAGRVHVYFDNVLACGEAIARGDVVPLAVSARARAIALPQVPTLAERGFAGHALDIWFGVFGAHLADDAHARAQQLAHDTTLRVQLRAMGLDGGPRSAAALAEEVRASAPAWMRALAAAEAG